MRSPEVQLTYAPRTDATPEVESAVLANVYRFILDASNKKAGAVHTGEDDAERRSDEIRANPIIPRR